MMNLAMILEAGPVPGVAEAIGKVAIR